MKPYVPSQDPFPNARGISVVQVLFVAVAGLLVIRAYRRNNIRRKR